MTHLLVTNDFPPKVGGIQSYLWELWRRLPPGEATVLTTPHAGDLAWDREQPFRVVRSRRRALLPTPGLVREVDRLAAEVGASLVLLDPAWPLGMVGRHLDRPYGVVLHGAEVTIPGRLPGTRALLGHVLRGARLVVAAGGYPAAEGERAARSSLPSVLVPPGVDVERFVPLEPEARSAVRARLLARSTTDLGAPAIGTAARSRPLAADGGPGRATEADADLPSTDLAEADRPNPEVDLVLSVSRLVPRKGMDVLIEAAALLAPTHPRLRVVIAGDGRDRARLERLVARTGAPVRLLGRVDDDDLPALYGAADVFAMVCRNRWAGLEQEGFGIVYLEAAAAGVPQVAGRSGGSHEAVVDGVTGVVVDDPRSVPAVAAALAGLLEDPARRARIGAAARRRVVHELTYDRLAVRLADALAGV
ncbi:MAG: glycosyltransferase [Acidimicrobiales bacterium]